MAKIVSVNLDVEQVCGALSGAARDVKCYGATDVTSVLAHLDAGVPDLIVLGGDASAAADIAEVLIDEPGLLGTPLVGWTIGGSLGDTSRLLALGVQVVGGDANEFRTVCDDALDAREGRTVRVDAPTEVQAPADEALDLHGRRVLVVDDDPAITWYFADIVRTQGCDVEEATDGAVALDRARRTMPDLVISDIRMPGMDGPRLCRALRVDPILGDVPVVLLSWKEDWLRRAEECGVEASAYLAKRSTPEEALGCIREVLANNGRLERRLRIPGAVRGRLDGTAPYRLLRLACATRPDARLTLQCHLHAYEVRIREGAPRSATRVARDSSILRGSPALASLLAERAGRFTLDVERTPIETELSGGLHQQIAAYVARSRGAVPRPAPVAAPPPAPEPAPASVAPPPPPPAVVAVAPVIQAAPVLAPRPMPEPATRTVPIPPRPFVPRLVVVTPRAPAEPTLPLAPSRPAVQRSATTVVEAAPSVRRSWKAALRWVGVAAIAALGLVLGAGVHALRQPPADRPAPVVVARPR
jgi:CheY-like chemotaxis protein